VIQEIIWRACNFQFSIHTENLFTTKWSPCIQVFLPHTRKLIISLLVEGRQRHNQECSNDTVQDMLWQAHDNIAYMSDVHQIQVFVSCYTERQGCWLPKFWRCRRYSPSKCLLLTALHKSTYLAQPQKCSPSKTGQVNLLSNICCVLNVLCFLLGDSPASVV
jgi:hypothetical protein